MIVKNDYSINWTFLLGFKILKLEKVVVILI